MTTNEMDERPGCFAYTKSTSSFSGNWISVWTQWIQCDVVNFNWSSEDRARLKPHNAPFRGRSRSNLVGVLILPKAMVL